MGEAYICDDVRISVRADDFGAVPLKALPARNAGLDPGAIDGVGARQSTPD